MDGYGDFKLVLCSSSSKTTFFLALLLLYVHLSAGVAVAVASSSVFLRVRRLRVAGAVFIRRDLPAMYIIGLGLYAPPLLFWSLLAWYLDFRVVNIRYIASMLVRL